MSPFRRQEKGRLPAPATQSDAATERKVLRVQRHKPVTHYVRKYYDILKRAILDLPSEPSDPLKSSEGNSNRHSASDIASTYQAREKLDDDEWYVNQTIVNSDKYVEKGVNGDSRGRQHSQEDGVVATDNDFNWDSLYGYMSPSIWRNPRQLPWFLWRLVRRFYNMADHDEERERQFQKELWYERKTPARFAACFLIINWALFLGLYTIDKLYEKIIYHGGLTLFTVPAFFMIAFNMPNSPSRAARTFFQVWFAIATWYCGITMIIDAYICGFFRSPDSANTCGSKTFISMIFYQTALPCIAQFTILRRFYNALGQLVVLVLMFVLIVPEGNSGFIRNLVNFMIFSVFIQWLHYSKEKARRRIFRLQYRVRSLYRATNRAQMAEKKAAAAKQQFSSYIFHEVRVPLNTATLALHNLRLKGHLDIEDPDTRMDVYALEGGMSMTAQILNDVLDLQRTVSEQFKIDSSPFPLHKAISSALRFLDVETSSKNIHLDIRLDERIDHLAVDQQSTDGLRVFGDELRLRQLIGNLASNAVKFTPEGGTIQVTTQLIWPPAEDEEEPDSPLICRAKASDKKSVVWRLEVHDSGPGIKPSDLWGTSLFQPFVQTSVGKNSGSGSGLGLAIVKSIVTVSGGRLGIVSQKDNGATFWVEMLYTLANAEQVANSDFNGSSQPPPDASRSILQLPSRAASMTPSLPSPTASSIHAEPSEMSVPRPPFMRSVSDVLANGALPMDPPPSPLALQSSRIEDTVPLKLLVVDDDAITRQMMSRMLSIKYGCIVETANDGNEALDKIIGPRPDGQEVTKYDMICMDNLMPFMSGEECVRRIRRARRDDFIVGCTGNALHEDTVGYMQAGIDEVLTKPVNLSILGQYVNKARELRAIRLKTQHTTSRSEDNST